MIKQKHIAYYNAKTDLYAVLPSSGDMYVHKGYGTTEVAPFFEHEKGFSVCDTFRDCTLIDTDFSPLLRRKLLRMIDC